MDEKQLTDFVQRLLLTELAKHGERFVPIASSNHHIHLSQVDVERLFGTGYQLTKMRDLKQPGQFACNERVTIETPKGKMLLRVVGPARKETQVELSMTDGIRLGIKPPIRMSGNLAGSPGCIIANGEHRITLAQGVIVAARHVHLSKDEATAYGVQNGDTVDLFVDGPRPVTFSKVLVRCGDGHEMEVHIDTDEANACGLQDGQLGRMVLNKSSEASPVPIEKIAANVTKALTPMASHTVPAEVEKTLDLSQSKNRLLGENEVLQAVQSGCSSIRYAKNAIITPLARDAALSKRIKLIAV